MWDKPTQRRLAAVLAADIASYTRLMEQDTDGTVSAWHDARANVIDPQISVGGWRERWRMAVMFSGAIRENTKKRATCSSQSTIGLQKGSRLPT